MTADLARAHLIDALVRTGAEDRDAFRRVYDLTAAKLFGICLRICGDRGAAEDVLHDVYLIIWRRAGAFEPGRASPITWLATIARNRAIDWRRAAGRTQTAPIEQLPEIPDTAPLPGDRLEVAGEDARLRDCLGALDDKQRQAIRITFFDGLTYAELAERQGVPLGTCKSWIRRGLAGLKRCLAT